MVLHSDNVSRALGSKICRKQRSEVTEVQVWVLTQAGFTPNAVRANTEESWQEVYLDERGHGSG